MIELPNEDQLADLIEAARQAGEQAHAPYSQFRVGAALLCADGQTITGCNVENASYGLTCCAERNAVFAAVARGQRAFVALAIVADPADEPTPPCGACRQVLWEFCRESCPDLPIVSATRSGQRQTYRLSQLLPDPFG